MVTIVDDDTEALEIRVMLPSSAASIESCRRAPFADPEPPLRSSGELVLEISRAKTRV